MTLKQTRFGLGLLISQAFLFQVFNATNNLKGTRAKREISELKSGDKSLFWHVF